MGCYWQRKGNIVEDLKAMLLEIAGVYATHALRQSNKIAHRHARYFMPKGKKFFNVRSERRLKESISTVHIFADGIIKSRIIDERSEDRHNLLSLFIGIPENNHSSDFLRDIVISIIIAGRDTTSSALKWFSWLLSSKLYVEHAILNELEMIRVRNGKRVGDIYDLDELRDMQYLHTAISKAM
ncbi:hypothetical protein ACFX19_015990 [Malus domestica]